MPAPSRPAKPNPVAEREITLVRVFEAPRELVFSMWTEQKHLAKWWGPHGFDNPLCEADPRVGGAIRIHMRGPDGTIHAIDGTFREIVPHERIVFTTSVDDNGVRLLEGENVVTFEDIGGKTRLTLHARASGFAEITKRMLGGMEMGWSQSLEKLAALLGG